MYGLANRNAHRAKELFMRVVITNTFSTNMVEKDGYLFFGRITEQMAANILYAHDKEVLSIIKQQSLADLLSVRLGVVIPTNNVGYIMQKDDQVIVVKPQRLIEKGKVLSLDEIREMPIKFMLIK